MHVWHFVLLYESLSDIGLFQVKTLARVFGGLVNWRVGHTS